MSEVETGEQIELLLGKRPSRTFVAGIYARSEGNAFFTEQLVAAGTTEREDRALPAGLTSLLLARTGQVTGTAQEVLAALAVAARPLDEASVARMCGRPDREVREALRDLLSRWLLRRPDRAGRHQLRHALLAEAISRELLPSEQRQLHAQVADLMADWNNASLAAQIAEHYAAADRPVDELRWRVLAGRHANAVYAFSEAAEHWQRAVALCAGAPITLVVEGMSLAELYGAVEDALELSGNEEAARARAEEALVRLADADPTSRADVLRRAGEMRGHSASQRGLDLLYQALALYQQLPASAGHVEALRDIAGILLQEGRQADAAELADRAAALPECSGQRSAHLELLGHQAWHEMACGDGELAVQHIRALRERLTERDPPDLHARLATVHTDILLNVGRLAEVEAAAASALQMAAAFGTDQSFHAAMLRANMFEALTERGSIDAAARLIDPVSQGTVSVTTRFDYEDRATLEMLRGNLDGAQKRQAELGRLPLGALSFQESFCIQESELQLWRGAPGVAFEQSHALLVRSAAADQGTLSGPLLTLAGRLLNLALRACADLAERARTSRDSEALNTAQRRADQLSELHQQVTPDPFTPGPLRPTAAADYAIWQAEWSRLRDESDAEMWEQAATSWDALTRPHRAAYARWRQAEALLAAPQGRAAASTVLRTAAGQAVQHVPLSTAIHDLARRARIDLDEAGQRVQHDKPPPPTRPFGLTDRELAVLRLLAEGRTNPEIGAVLFISAKTASVHVTHILRKLGVATRVRAATVAERAGLLNADPARPTR
jgi:DNA-binding CsgD family transcriptional regulator